MDSESDASLIIFFTSRAKFISASNQVQVLSGKIFPFSLNLS